MNRRFVRGLGWCLALFVGLFDKKAKADTIIQCVNTNMAVSQGTVISGDSTFVWQTPAIDVSGQTSQGNMFGYGFCSSDQGSKAGAIKTELKTSTTLDNNKYCWCRIYSPALSDWFYSPKQGYSTWSACIAGCSDSCAASGVYYATGETGILKKSSWY